jgi:hypothetical protein
MKSVLYLNLLIYLNLKFIDIYTDGDSSTRVFIMETIDTLINCVEMSMQ